jgi:serine/threonine-protein kinase
MDKYIGKRLDGRYEIKEIVGVGGMAIVYKAYDRIDNKQVAVKILKDEFLQNEEFTRRFKNESKAIAILSHENIVKVLDVGFGENIKYIVMEYINGITLKEYIEKKGKLRWNEACHFTAQILEALHEAHSKGIIHRDIKPQNIIVLPDGSIKVTDFGIARFTQSEQQTITDKAIGSVHYISPEQAKGGAIDERADIYSLGVILYEMLTGRVPFESDSAVSVAIMQLQAHPPMPREIDPSIPLGLEDITMHAMEKDKSRRYQSAYDMKRDLKRFMSNPGSRFNSVAPPVAYVDRQPTRYINRAEIEDAYDDYEEVSDHKKLKITLSIIAALALATIVLFGIIALMGSGGTVFNLECPNLVGQNLYTDIPNNSEWNKLNITVEKEEYGEQPNGTILEQSIRPGKSIKSNTEILVKISKGEESVKIGDYKDMNFSIAEARLKSKGLVVEIKQKYDDAVQPDCVIGTKPKANTEVENGSVVTLYVSLGAPQSYVKMPYITNLKESDARARLAECNLTVGKITTSSSDKPKGVVISQEVAAGDELASGTAVGFVISSGETGKLKSSVNITLPNDDRTVIVNLFKNGESVYESSKIKMSSKGTLRVDIEGSGISKYTVTLTGSGMNQYEYMTFSYNFDTKQQYGIKTNSLPPKPEIIQSKTQPSNQPHSKPHNPIPQHRH